MAESIYQEKQDRQTSEVSQRKSGVALQDNRGAGQRIAQLAVAHAPGCGCAGCSGQATGIAQTLQAKAGASGLDVVQLNCKYCGSAKHNNANCPNKGGNPNHGPAPTGRYKNTTGHHDPTLAKWRKKSVKKSYTGKLGKK